ncbi:MAG: prepilin-type N-terminal cleavage/methylation domain-containing protein [Acidobacteria bacterium]|nr:MAG: prepilin-type N-terminal cleavage/methylation domain-containing protein [Acidobacteriota bacterium]
MAHHVVGGLPPAAASVSPAHGDGVILCRLPTASCQLRDGYSLVEVLVSLALSLMLAGLATPVVLGARDAVRATSAGDHVAAVLQRARTEALRRNRYVAVRFEPDGPSVRYALYADGNGDGVRSAQIGAGLDPMLQAAERVEQHFPGVAFGLADGVPTVDGEGAGDGDPIRVGRSRMISFSPAGTCTPGTIYLLGRGRQQLAVRVLGATGRIRTLQFNFSRSAWQER